MVGIKIDLNSTGVRLRAGKSYHTPKEVIPRSGECTASDGFRFVHIPPGCVRKRKGSFLSGLVTAFVRSITAISAIILLVTPQFLLITVQINEFAEKGSYGIACAFATILIVITYGSVLLMNLFIKYFGTSRKLKEVD